MFLHELGSSDSRFKQLRFHEGMNILLADKTKVSTQGDSRNGAGKTSFIRILRYLLGGNLDDSLKSEALADSSFCADFGMGSGTIHVIRQSSPHKKVRVDGNDIAVPDWKATLSDLFSLPEGTGKPTVAQLFSQLVRDYFGDPLKIFAVESSWESGLRIGYFLGFSPETLIKAGEIQALEKNQKALKKAISDGAFGMAPNEAELRAALAQTREQRDQLETSLTEFRVDERYAEHQTQADLITQEIRDLNDEGVSLEQRKRELAEAMAQEQPVVTNQTVQQLETMYEELGVVLPEVVVRRYDEVSAFHASVVRNRRLFLEREQQAVAHRLQTIEIERRELDNKRAELMRLLDQTMALETFREAQRDLTDLNAKVAAMEQRLEIIRSVNSGHLHLNSKKSEAEAGIRTEIAENEDALEKSIVLFQKLGEEIYSDRAVSLLVEATNKGVLKITPKIDGDASAGILGVKIFLLDLVSLVSAIKLERAPRILVHDSQLFDSMDDRQVASCLNIGARLADEIGFQYIVTLNSDRLKAAETEGFDRRDYVIKPVLTDVGEDGGLFGFRFK